MQRPAFLSLALLLGLAVTQSNIAASEPGYLDFDNLPETNFSCEGKVIGGYYADVETGCQMFHVCTIGQKGEVTDIKFLCLNGTVFDQETRVCERIDEVDCSRSESFFGLNLELYGNHPAAQGIAPEDECEEECPTEPAFDEYEDEEIDSTTYTPQTTTTTRPTTTTSRATTTTHPPSTIPVPPPPQASFPSTSPETVAALLALHNAFTQSLNRHGKPPPPRVINNAFAPAEAFGRPAARPPTFQTPAPTFGTTRRPAGIDLGARYPPVARRPDRLQFGERPKPADYIHGYPRHHFPLTTTRKPPELRSNYQHFESGDARFTHSLDADKPYDFQYFGQSSSPSPSPFSVRSLGKDASAKAAVSVVTSTSSSTSVKTSRLNATSVDFPTGYDEYQDGEEIEDPFFRDVPKLPGRRSKRDLPSDRGYPGTYTTPEPATVPETPRIPERRAKQEKEEFLRNLLGSLDMKRQERRKLVEFFERVEPEMEKVIKNKEIDGFLSAFQNKIGQMDSLIGADYSDPTTNFTNFDYDIGDVDGERLTTSSEYRNDESADWTIGLNETERVRRDAGGRKFDENSSGLEYVGSDGKPFEDKAQNKRQAVDFRQRRIDTEKFAPEYESERRRSQGRSRTPVEATRRPGPLRPRPAVGSEDIRPVTEVIEDDVTTKEYRRANPGRTRVRVASVKSIEGRVRNSQHGRRPQTRFDSYETTTRAAHPPTLRRKIIAPPPKTSPDRPVTEPTEESDRPDRSNPQPNADGDSSSRTLRPMTVRHTTPSTTTTTVPPPTTPPPRRELDSTPGRPERPRGRRLKTIEATTPYLQEKKEAGPRKVNARRGPPRPLYFSTQPPIEPPPPPVEDLREDPDFSCGGKIKGGYYADVPSACRGFFICSQGEINGPLLKTHFWCGTATKFNQRSRTCQADYLVDCSISERYYHLNQDQLVPESEDQLRGDFEPSKL